MVNGAIRAARQLGRHATIRESAEFNAGVQNRLAELKGHTQNLIPCEICAERTQVARADGWRTGKLRQHWGSGGSEAIAAKADVFVKHLPLDGAKAASRTWPLTACIAKHSDLGRERVAMNRGLDQRLSESDTALSNFDFRCEIVGCQYHQVRVSKRVQRQVT